MSSFVAADNGGRQFEKSIGTRGRGIQESIGERDRAELFKVDRRLVGCTERECERPADCAEPIQPARQSIDFTV